MQTEIYLFLSVVLCTYLNIKSHLIEMVALVLESLNHWPVYENTMHDS